MWNVSRRERLSSPRGRSERAQSFQGLGALCSVLRAGLATHVGPFVRRSQGHVLPTIESLTAESVAGSAFRAILEHDLGLDYFWRGTNVLPSTTGARSTQWLGR